MFNDELSAEVIYRWANDGRESLHGYKKALIIRIWTAWLKAGLDRVPFARPDQQVTEFLKYAREFKASEQIALSATLSLYREFGPEDFQRIDDDTLTELHYLYTNMHMRGVIDFTMFVAEWKDTVR